MSTGVTSSIQFETQKVVDSQLNFTVRRAESISVFLPWFAASSSIAAGLSSSNLFGGLGAQFLIIVCMSATDSSAPC